MCKVSLLALASILVSTASFAEISPKQKDDIKKYLIYKSKYAYSKDPIDLAELRQEGQAAVQKLKVKIGYLIKDTARLEDHLKAWKKTRYNPYSNKTRWLRPRPRKKLIDDCCRARRDKKFAEEILLKIERTKAYRTLRKAGAVPWRSQ